MDNINKIPTAEEFLADLQSSYDENNEYRMYFAIDLPKKLKEFAKLHVEAARKEILTTCKRKVKLTNTSLPDALKRAITKSYPVENIK